MLLKLENRWEQDELMQNSFRLKKGRRELGVVLCPKGLKYNNNQEFNNENQLGF